MTSNNSEGNHQSYQYGKEVSRRNIAKSAAWTAPVIVATIATPAHAASSFEVAMRIKNTANTFNWRVSTSGAVSPSTGNLVPGQSYTLSLYGKIDGTKNYVGTVTMGGNATAIGLSSSYQINGTGLFNFTVPGGTTLSSATVSATYVARTPQQTITLPDMPLRAALLQNSASVQESDTTTTPATQQESGPTQSTSQVTTTTAASSTHAAS